MEVGVFTTKPTFPKREASVPVRTWPSADIAVAPSMTASVRLTPWASRKVLRLDQCNPAVQMVGVKAPVVLLLV
jgi:hypothetical protein